MKVAQRVQLFATPWTLQSMEFSRPSCFLLQGIFPTQGLNPGFQHCRRILYQLSHMGSPRILEWVAYPFSSGSSQPRDELGSPALQEDSLPASNEESPKREWRSNEVAWSCATLQFYALQFTRLLHPWNFPGKSTGVGCHFLLQGIFPTPG